MTLDLGELTEIGAERDVAGGGYGEARLQIVHHAPLRDRGGAEGLDLGASTKGEQGEERGETGHGEAPERWYSSYILANRNVNLHMQAFLFFSHTIRLRRERDRST